jgi:crotonobetainyl-CoA:carnitine CoA-transferase CaiB-like acyl-CoA transferase
MTHPLEGLRVADFSWFVAGPLAARTLADFGADVIRVESETHVDGLRIVQPFPPGTDGLNVSGYFNNANASKRSLLLNMSEPDARAVALRLIAASDVFITNFTPRVIERWRLTYDELRQINPRIIALYAPMQGLSGPRKNFLGFGAVLTPITGLNYLTGFAHRPPAGVGTNYPDYTINPGHSVVAIMAALRHRDRTGEGQMIELSQLESVATTIAPALMDYAANGRVQTRRGNRSDWMAPHGAFRCLDEPRRHTPLPTQSAERERWIVLAIRDDEDWRALCDVAGNAPFTQDTRFQTLLGRKQNEDDLEQEINKWTGRQQARAIVQRLQEAGVPAGIVQDAEDMLDHDEHLRERGYYVQLDHPETGLASHDGPVAKLHATPGALRSPAPLIGEHTYQVATEVLGYSPDEVADLVAKGILA